MPGILDTFNRADSASSLGTSDTGQTWTVTGTWGIQSGQAFNTSSGASVTALIECGENDVLAEGSIYWGDGGTLPGLVFRALNDDNRLGIFLNAGANAVELWRTTSGSGSVITSASATIDPDNTYIVRVRAVGTSITAWLDGVQVLTHTLTGNDASQYTDSGYTQVGFRGSTEHRFDYITAASSSATAPTVSAGSDASIQTNQQFQRAATISSDGGAPVYIQGWSVVSGPDLVGPVSTTGTVSITPTVSGTYTLRYSATNLAGTSTDDMLLTVTSGSGGGGTGEVEIVAAYEDGATGGAAEVTVPNVQVGDWIVAVHGAIYFNPGDLGVGGTGAGSWVEIGSGGVGGPVAPDPSNYNYSIRTWYKVAESSGTYTVTTTGTNNEACLGVLHLRGADSIDGATVDVKYSQNAGESDNTVELGSFTTSSDSCLLVACYGLVRFSGTGTWTPPSGMDEQVDVTDPNGFNYLGVAAEMIPTAGSSGSKTATHSVAGENNGSAGRLFAIVPAAAPEPPAGPEPGRMLLAYP